MILHIGCFGLLVLVGISWCLSAPYSLIAENRRATRVLLLKGFRPAVSECEGSAYPATQGAFSVEWTLHRALILDRNDGLSTESRKRHC